MLGRSGADDDVDLSAIIPIRAVDPPASLIFLVTAGVRAKSTPRVSTICSTLDEPTPLCKRVITSFCDRGAPVGTLYPGFGRPPPMGLPPPVSGGSGR